MSSSPLLRSTLGVAAILCVSLTTATVVQTKRVHNLQARLDEVQGKLNQVKATRPSSDSAGVPDEMLRQLLTDKEAEYADLYKQYTELQRSVNQAAARPAGPPGSMAPASFRRGGGPGFSRGQGNAWLDRMRQEDPQRYQQIVGQREQRRQQAQQAFQDEIVQLDARAQSAATPEEADLVGQITDTVTKLNDLRSQMQAARNLPEDDPQRQPQIDQLGADMRATYQQLNQLRDQDRTLQLQNLAADLGLQGDKVQSLVDGVPQIYRNTQYNRGQGGGGPGGGGGRQGQPAQPPTQSQPQTQPQTQQTTLSQ